jgi:hypothetical protein
MDGITFLLPFAIIGTVTLIVLLFRLVGGFFERREHVDEAIKWASHYERMRPERESRIMVLETRIATLERVREKQTQQVEQLDRAFRELEMLVRAKEKAGRK